MPYDPAQELDKLAIAHENLANALRQAAETVRQADVEGKLVTVRLESTPSAGIGRVRITELPASEIYKGLTIGAAAEAFVRAEGRPIGNAELLDGLGERGVRVDSPEALAAALIGSANITFSKGRGWIMKPAKPKPTRNETPPSSGLKVATLDEVKQFFRKKSFNSQPENSDS